MDIPFLFETVSDYGNFENTGKTAGVFTAIIFVIPSLLEIKYLYKHIIYTYIEYSGILWKEIDLLRYVENRKLRKNERMMEERLEKEIFH
jgi:hypothetical protein